jgi:ribosome maturation factor RimP
MSQRAEETVREMADRVAEAAGLEVYDVDLGRSGSRWILTVYLDRPGGSVGLADCQAVSEQLSVELEQADPIPHAYTLEVSSPGMDRLLRTETHWQRSTGARVRFALKAAREGRRRFRGRLLSVNQGRATVQVDDGGVEAFDLGDVQSARVEPEF